MTKPPAKYFATAARIDHLSGVEVRLLISTYQCLLALQFLVLICCGTGNVLAQSPGVQQLKDKLQALEQTVQDLKKELAAVEQSQKPAAKPPAAPATEPGYVPAPQIPADYIGKETRDRDTAGQNEVGASRLDNEALDPELRGFFRLPGTSTMIKFGGFVKTDLFYDLKYAGSYYGAYVPSSFPASPQPVSANSTVSMRPSRFSMEVRQPVESGGSEDTVKVYFEFDFLGDYDRNSLRLRQFYGQYKNFLAGQTWTAFGDPDAFPDTLEFEGPPGIIGLRNPQFRYTQPLNKHNWLGISVEKSGTDTPFSTQFGTPIGTSVRPDLIGFYRYENRYGHIHLAAISRSVGGFIQNSTQPDLTNHVNGYGASLSAVWGLGAWRDSIVFQSVIGKGISNYYNDNFGLGTDVGFDAHGHLVATPTGSTEAGYTHYWTKVLRSSFSYGYLRINNTAFDPGTTYHTSNYATGNFIVQPTVRFLFGGEYIYGSARRKDNFEWVAPRIQGSITYYINKYPREQ